MPDQTPHVRSPGRTLPLRSSNTNATPGTMTRSSQPLSIAGRPLHQVGYTNTRQSAHCDQAGVLAGRARRSSGVVAVVGVPLLGRHRDPEAERVQVDDLDHVTAGPQAGDRPLGRGVGEAVVARVSDHHECLHPAASVRAPAHDALMAGAQGPAPGVPMPNPRAADARYRARWRPSGLEVGEVDRRLRRALVRVVGATTIVVGVTVTASAVRRADQVVASGREVLMGDRLVDTFVGGDLSVVRNVETAGIVVALGDLAVDGGSLRIERASARVFAVGGSLAVGDDASIILPATGVLKYGTIRTGAPGSPDTVTRDPNAVSAFTPMVASLESSARCFAAIGDVGHRDAATTRARRSSATASARSRCSR